MKPKPWVFTVQPGFFRTEFQCIINLQHRLVKLAEEFIWDELER